MESRDVHAELSDLRRAVEILRAELRELRRRQTSRSSDQNLGQFRTSTAYSSTTGAHPEMQGNNLLTGPSTVSSSTIWAYPEMQGNNLQTSASTASSWAYPEMQGNNLQTSASTASSWAYPEMQDNNHLRIGASPSTTWPYPEMQGNNLHTSASIASSMTTWAHAEMQGYNVLQTSASTIAPWAYPEMQMNILQSGASAALPWAFPDLICNHLPIGIPMDEQEEPPVIVQDSDTRNASVESSLVTKASPDTQRKRNLDPPPSVAKDQVTTDEGECKCAICLDTTDCTEMKALPCAHVFHEECVTMWLKVKRRCPLCREPTFSPHQNLNPEILGSFMPLFDLPEELEHIRRRLGMQEEALLSFISNRPHGD
ncbi:unnamed protein product [Larinioides sclopetarius]|uniref:RING-type domain-containing protein n=1 Tax=Larinioides sclopetarius TaxID=280406 RepID=A0AAV2B4P6_9ARAC